jgi:small multidrug resistance family-3 protein
MLNYVWFIVAAGCEIAGCYAVWLWLRLDRSPLWLVPGTASLLVFAFALTRVESELAGRAYAAYGGIYIVASLAWLALVERTRPTLADVSGAAICIVGATVILFGMRLAA